MKKKIRICAPAMGLFLAFTIWPNLSRAGVFEVVPAIRIATEYDDNIDFTSSDKEDDFSASARPGVSLNYNTELTRFSGRAEVDIKRYFNQTDFDRVNQLYRMGIEYQAHPRWTLLAHGQLTRDETTDTQFEETGRVFERNRRTLYEADGGVRYSLSELTNLGVTLTYVKTDFNSDEDVDNDRYTVELPFRKNFTNELDTILLVPAYSYFNSDDEKANDYRSTITWLHLLSETVSSELSFGVRYTDIEDKNTGQNNSNWGGTGSAALRKKGETFSGEVGYSRDLRADTEGNIIEVNHGFLHGDKRMTERFGLRFDGNFYYSSRERQQANSDKVQTFDLAPAFYYMLTQHHTLELSYRYRKQDELDEPGNPTTQQNTVALRLILSFPKRWE